MEGAIAIMVASRHNGTRMTRIPARITADQKTRIYRVQNYPTLLPALIPVFLSAVIRAGIRVIRVPSLYGPHTLAV
jgi:hypothetical protein